MATLLPHYLGCPFPITNGSPGVYTHTLDGSLDGWEAVFEAEEGGTITHVGVFQSGRGGTAPTYRVSLQGVGTNGHPDGSIKASGNAYVDWNPVVGGDLTWVWHALGASYAATRGERLSVVIAHQTGTINGSNYVTVAYNLSGVGLCYNFPHTNTLETGVRSKKLDYPVYGYKTASRAYGTPMGNTASAAYLLTSGSSPDEVAVRFNLAAGLGSTYKVAGVRFLGVAPAGKTARVQLYDTDGTTVLNSAAIDSDDFQGNSIYRNIRTFFEQDALASLNFGSTYRLGIRPDDASGDWELAYLPFTAAADMTAYPGGTDIYVSRRTDDGAWTDITDRRLFADLIIDDITGAGAGGGGAMKRAGAGGGRVA